MTGLKREEEAVDDAVEAEEEERRRRCLRPSSESEEVDDDVDIERAANDSDGDRPPRRAIKDEDCLVIWTDGDKLLLILNAGDVVASVFIFASESTERALELVPRRRQKAENIESR